MRGMSEERREEISLLNCLERYQINNPERSKKILSNTTSLRDTGETTGAGSDRLFCAGTVFIRLLFNNSIHYDFKKSSISPYKLLFLPIQKLFLPKIVRVFH